MSWVPWVKIPKPQSPAVSATDRSALDKASAPPAEPSSTSEPWSKDFHAMSLVDQMTEIVDHLKRLRAEVGAMRAEWRQHEENHEGSRGDMTQPRT